MADGIQRKFALIINGDPTEEHHFENVDRAIETLKAEDPDYEIVAANSKKPALPISSYLPPNRKNLETMIAGLGDKIDDDDLFTLYVTGHGDVGKRGEGCVDLPDGCLSNQILSDRLKTLQYGRRLVIMDNCYSGGAVELFADDKTEIVTAGSPGEKVSCQNFSPFLWGRQVPDLDKDGVVSLVERYRYALRAGKNLTWSNYFSTEPSLALSGSQEKDAPFAPQVVEVQNQIQLKQELRQLQPGQVALVMFSAFWCKPCHQYFPHFQKLAQEYGGQILMIHAELSEERKDHLGEDWGNAESEFSLQTFPQLTFVDHREGKLTVFPEYWARPRDFLLAHPVLSLSEKEKLEYMRRQFRDPSLLKKLDQALKDPNPKVKGEIPKLLLSLPENSSFLIKYLSHFFKDPNPLIRSRAAYAVSQFCLKPQAQEAISDLMKLAKDPDPQVRLAAIDALLQIGRPRYVVTSVIPLGHYTYTTGMITQWPFAPEPLVMELLKLRQDKNPEVRRDTVPILILALDEERVDYPKNVIDHYLGLLQDPDEENRISGLSGALVGLDEFHEYFNLEKRRALAQNLANQLRNDPLARHLGDFLWVTSSAKDSIIPETVVMVLEDLGEHSPQLLKGLRGARAVAQGERRELIESLLDKLERKGNYLEIGADGAYVFGDSGHFKTGARAGYSYRWNRAFEWRSQAAWHWLSTAPNSGKDYQVRLSTGPAVHWPHSLGRFDPYATGQVGFFHQEQEAQNGITVAVGAGLQYFLSDQWLLDGAASMVVDIPFSGTTSVGVQVPLGLAHHF